MAVSRAHETNAIVHQQQDETVVTAACAKMASAKKTTQVHAHQEIAFILFTVKNSLKFACNF